MAVADAELLALAGGDSSDEEGTPQKTTRNANSPLPSIEVSHAPDRKSKHRPPFTSKSRGASGKAGMSRNVDSEEEGEA